MLSYDLSLLGSFCVFIDVFVAQQRDKTPEKIDTQPPTIELHGNPSSFAVYANVRQAVLEQQTKHVSQVKTCLSRGVALRCEISCSFPCSLTDFLHSVTLNFLPSFDLDLSRRFT